MQKSVPRSFSTELNLPRCVPGTPESADPVLVSHDANQAPKQPNECVVCPRNIQKSTTAFSAAHRNRLSEPMREASISGVFQLRIPMFCAKSQSMSSTRTTGFDNSVKKWAMDKLEGLECSERAKNIINQKISFFYIEAIPNFFLNSD